jgi:hypothetical protein
MVRGAFTRFDHDHYFTPTTGGTLLRDVFDYRAPLGTLGQLAEGLILTAYMRRFLLARLALSKRSRSPTAGPDSFRLRPDVQREVTGDLWKPLWCNGDTCGVRLVRGPQRL